jgi:hypothetical protein
MESSRGMSHNIQIFKAGIYFSSPASNCHISAFWKLINRGLFSSQNMAMTILKSSIPSRGIDASILISTRNRFRGLDAWGSY